MPLISFGSIRFCDLICPEIAKLPDTIRMQPASESRHHLSERLAMVCSGSLLRDTLFASLFRNDSLMRYKQKEMHFNRVQSTRQHFESKDWVKTIGRRSREQFHWNESILNFILHSLASHGLGRGLDEMFLKKTR
jgi:hypothetical protein